MAKTVYIAGLGLIGASMALGIKRDHPDYEILGYNRSQASRVGRFELERRRHYLGRGLNQVSHCGSC